MNNHKIIFLFYAIPQLIFADMKIVENAGDVFSKNNPIRPAIYKITEREFSKSDAAVKLKFLKTQGFTYTLKNDTGRLWSIKMILPDRF
jgi:hypothetical protein